MIKLRIVEVNGYVYTLKNNDNIYHLTIEFYDLDKKPSVNDFIFLHEKILSENNPVYSFGALDEKYGRDLNSIEEKELIALVIDQKMVYLKRFYG